MEVSRNGRISVLHLVMEKDYQKYDKNPVMTGEMLPEGCNRVDFRDPKIWKENDTYYMIVGNKNENQIGQVVLCSSKNLTDWKFETITCFKRKRKNWYNVGMSGLLSAGQ